MTRQRRQRVQNGQALSSRLAVLGKLCLMASLWHAPVPLLHAHGSDVADPVAARLAVEHLTKYHVDVRLNSHVDLGWHWHLVLLANPVVDEPCDTDGHPDCNPAYNPYVVTQVATPSTQAMCDESPSALNWSVARAPGLIRCAAPEKPSQFLGTYLEAVPLRTLLCVIRC